MVQELIFRKQLKVALSGRDAKSLIPLLKFVVKYISNPRYTKLFWEVTTEVLGICFVLLSVFEELTFADLYSSVVGQSQEVDYWLKRLKNTMLSEIELQKQMQQLLGQLEMVMAVSTPTTVDDE